MSETETMVERVARAIYAIRGYGAMAWSRQTEAYKKQYRADARAAIEAMREPTDAMSAAMLKADGTYAGWAGEHRNPVLTQEEADRIGLSDHLSGNAVHWKKPLWRAAIDASLKD